MDASEQTRAAPHPVIYLLLFLPFGASGGYVSVTLGRLLSDAGISVAAVAALIGATYLPNTLKVLWAPLVDTTLTAKRWYIIATVITGLGLLANAFIPMRASQLPLLNAVLLVTA